MNVRQLFPNASQATVEANSSNPQLVAPNGGSGKQNDSMGIVGSRKAKRIGTMNRCEAEFALILEAMKRKGEILRFEYEGITLRWADMRYTPDFVVFYKTDSTMLHGCEFITEMRLIEVKGGWTKGKFERAVERFRHAKTYYGDVFQFELHQKTKNGWKRIY